MKAMRIAKVPTDRQISAFYDAIAKDGQMQEKMYQQPHARDRLERVKALLPPGGRILEIGCADGIMSREIAACADWLVGVDVAQDSIDRCNAIGLENAEFICGTVEDLFDDLGEFDMVVACEVLEHQRNPATFLEVLSELAPVVLVTVPIAEMPNRDAFSVEAYRNPTKAGDGSGHIWCFREGTLRDLFTEILHYEDNNVSGIVIGRRG